MYLYMEKKDLMENCAYFSGKRAYKVLDWKMGGNSEYSRGEFSLESICIKITFFLNFIPARKIFHFENPSN